MRLYNNYDRYIISLRAYKTPQGRQHVKTWKLIYINKQINKQTNKQTHKNTPPKNKYKQADKQMNCWHNYLFTEGAYNPVNRTGLSHGFVLTQKRRLSTQLPLTTKPRLPDEKQKRELMRLRACKKTQSPEEEKSKAAWIQRRPVRRHD